MLLVKMIVYVLLLIKTVLSSILTYFIPDYTGGKPKAMKVEVKNTAERHNRSGIIRQKCVGCQSPQKESVDPWTPSRFLSNRKLTKKELENASFTKPTLSSLLKKNGKTEAKEEFEKTLRRYKKYSSTNSISSYSSKGTKDVKTNQSSSNENISEYINKHLCYASISEVQQMDEVVNYLPPIQRETCVPIEEETHELKITTVEVYRAETVKQYDSDDSQIFTDESPDEYPRSTPESAKENVSEDSQIYSDEEEKENLDDNLREERVRQRIQSGLAKIDKLAEEMDAENDPLYRRLFSNLRNATIYLCKTSDDWELGKRRGETSEICS